MTGQNSEDKANTEKDNLSMQPSEKQRVTDRSLLPDAAGFDELCSQKSIMKHANIWISEAVDGPLLSNASSSNDTVMKTETFKTRSPEHQRIKGSRPQQQG